MKNTALCPAYGTAVSISKQSGFSTFVVCREKAKKWFFKQSLPLGGKLR